MTPTLLAPALSPMVRDGSVVAMDYTVRLEDGRVIETTRGKAPVEYLHGGGQLLPALERALDGLLEGQEVEFTLEPPDAYGERRQDSLSTLPRSAFPADVELAPGVALLARNSQGEGFALTVREVREAEVVVDTNHPLAGERLRFQVAIRAVRDAAEGELFTGKPLDVEKV